MKRAPIVLFSLAAAVFFAALQETSAASLDDVALPKEYGRLSIENKARLGGAAEIARSARAGDAAAQAYLGYLYETGRGVPQSYVEAARWYRRSARQGNSDGQFLLGLVYDRGRGVHRNPVSAYMWLNLSAARASPADREFKLRIRDAVASKMTHYEIALGQRLALHWQARAERKHARPY
jgi:TPR repeat protein